MKYLVLSLFVFAAQMALATTANDFAGHYSLERETILHKNKLPVCSDSLEMTANGHAMNVVTMAFNVTSEINGPSVRLTDSTRSGEFRILFANDKLIFQLVGELPTYLSPTASAYEELIVLEPSTEANKLNVRHTFSSQEPLIQYDSQCVYVKN